MHDMQLSLYNESFTQHMIDDKVKCSHGTVSKFKNIMKNQNFKNRVNSDCKRTNTLKQDRRLKRIVRGKRIKCLKSIRRK